MSNAETAALVRQRARDALRGVFLAKRIQGDPGVPEEQIKAFYDAHLADFDIPDRWHGRQIVLDSQEQADEVRESLAGGADFAAVAREKSVDLFTRDEGGDMGWVEEGGAIPSLGANPGFESVIAKLAIGETSTPIKSARGFHLVQVLERETRGYRPLAEVLPELLPKLLISAQEIEKVYEDNKAKYVIQPSLHLWHILVASKKEALDARKRIVGGEPFEKVAKAVSTDLQSKNEGGALGAFARGSSLRGFGRLEPVEAAAFKLAENTVSAPVASEAGWHLLLVRDKQEESVRPLKEVENVIRNQLFRQRKQEIEKQAVQQLRERIGVEILSATE
ncbi:MAG: peptidyl-prolyl cis-trans isomerase [Candidatus Schekmanbacteria bacterium]|nr:peptidyl-prolyl cis-trans isomerase [Candidatus Schekmanbacteria bacterium]